MDLLEDSSYQFCYARIKEYNAEYNLDDLSKIALKENDFEVRVWISFVNGRQAVLFRNLDNKLKIYYLDDVKNFFSYFLNFFGLYKTKIEEFNDELGLKNLWSELVDNDILSLPDERELIKMNPTIDGVLYIVEILNESGYRCYSYLNPEYLYFEEAKKMVAIIEIIRDKILTKI